MVSVCLVGKFSDFKQDLNNQLAYRTKNGQTPVYKSRKGPLIGVKAVGVACRGILDFVKDCGLYV